MLQIDPRIQLKSPWLAAVLAFLLPGAGHFYQERFFKGVIYSVSILGTFFCGIALGDWQPVYHRMDSGHSHYGYLSQFMVGLPAMPAIAQSRRFINQFEQRHTPASGKFEGYFESAGGDHDDLISVSGRINLKTVRGKFGTEAYGGTFEGLTSDNEAARFRLGVVSIDPKVYPSRQRTIICDVLPSEANQNTLGRLSGSVPRPFQDWFQVPLDDPTLERLHGTLGKQFDLAVVYTWIAGLLNILAIWDAFEGPAYGYGDEDEPAPEPA